jgi:type I restriction-modification system DNA methylase subunit
LHKYDTIIMNPPFTRQERLPNYYKDILEKRFSSYSEYHSGCMGYYAWFLLLANFSKTMVDLHSLSLQHY